MHPQTMFSLLPLLTLVLFITSVSSHQSLLSAAPPWLSRVLSAIDLAHPYPPSSTNPFGLDMQHETISGPSLPNNRTEWESWMSSMSAYKRATLAAINYTSANYDSPASTWMRRAFIQPQAMIHDRFLYSPTAGWTVDRYLDDVERRYGGIDAVLLWHSYPNIGVDARNQFDMLRSLPAFPHGVREAIDRFHARGVRVILPYNPWDTGTNRSSPSAMAELIDLIALLGADGFNGDTMTGIPRAFFQDARTRYNLTLMLQAEVGLSSSPDALELPWQLASWGYWDARPALVSKYKFLEHRHTVNVCNRWAQSHQTDVQQAWLSGVGFEAWENVWSIWNELSPRDAQAVRQVATMSRRLWHLLAEPSLWLPHYVTVRRGVYASLFFRATETDVLLTFINTGEADATGVQLELTTDVSSLTFIDCYHGVVLTPSVRTDVDGEAVTQLAFDVEAGGFGCVLVASNASEWKAFMQDMRALTARPLASYSRHQDWLPQRVVTSPRTPLATSPPPGMTLVEGSSGWTFNVSGTEIEGGEGDGVDVQYDVFGETVPHRHHLLVINVSAFYVDTTPVTRAQYSQYLIASAYQPEDATNFLRQWTADRGVWTYPEGTADVPVTWVSLDEARAYCAFHHQRLIEEWEWQYVAQNGARYTEYPNGRPLNASLLPPVTSGPDPLDPSPVGAYPEAASLAGVQDLVYNKWEWTSETQDSHSRRAVLRGGSRYRPQGSMWYLPNRGEGTVHGLFLLMGGGMDRSQFIGFRCVQDAGKAEEAVEALRATVE